MALTSYQHTAHYTYVDQALRAQWAPFQALETEMAQFVPRPAEEFRPRRDAEIERLRVLNPDKTVDDLSAFVDRQFKVATSPDWQFHERFEQRHMTQFVTVIMLAHALSEALINATLAIGLANAGAAELFPLLEKNDFRQKWLYGPKSFAPDYKFPVGSALHESLTMLSRQRNALVHLKIELTVDGNKVLEGTDFERKHSGEERRWLRRYFSLPYDLAQLVGTSIKDAPFMLLFDRKPIEVAPVHVDA
jgi:hypothetical protein